MTKKILKNEKEGIVIEVIPTTLVKVKRGAKTYRSYHLSQDSPACIKRTIKDHSLIRYNFLKSLLGESDDKIKSQLMEIETPSPEEEVEIGEEKSLIKDSSLSNRSKNALIRAGYQYVEDIPQKRKELLKIKGLGKGSVDEIIETQK